MENMKPGQYLLETKTDNICILWSVSPLQVANLDTLKLIDIDKRTLQRNYMPVSVDIMYEIV